MTYAVKAAIADPSRRTFVLRRQKTMYGGKRIEAGDTIFVFASETDGGRGLCAKGVVTASRAVRRNPALARQTPRVDVTVRRTAVATRPLDRAHVRTFTNWDDGRPETELNFKFYRQATNKVVGLSPAAAAFLERFFR